MSRVLDASGCFTYVEIYGPPNFREWMLCWRVFTAICIMFRVVSSGRLRRYADKIATYVNRCPDAWGVIYQADVRTRSEHFPRVLEKATEYHAKAVARNWDSEFLPDKPWKEVFRRVLDDESDWWYELIEIPFQSIIPGAAKPSRFIGTDAVTRAENLGHGCDDVVPLPPLRWHRRATN